MTICKTYNPLDGIDLSCINDPEYNESAVREDIIAPLIKALGYTSTGNNKLSRGRKLKHPFVYIGKQKKDIFLFPDYVMEIDGKCAWIVEAKSPRKNLYSKENMEQAYSYSIHSEVRATYYALCNGKRFILCHIFEYKPILDFSLGELPLYWDTLLKLLSPCNFEHNHTSKLAKDYGLHLKRLGFDCFHSLNFYDLPISTIAKLENNLYTISVGIAPDYQEYCISFDFTHDVFLQIEGKIPQPVFEKLVPPLTGAIVQVDFVDQVYCIGVECYLSSDLQENEDELFLPLIIRRIIF
jgi:hypothetical protein